LHIDDDDDDDDNPCGVAIPPSGASPGGGLGNAHQI